MDFFRIKMDAFLTFLGFKTGCLSLKNVFFCVKFFTCFSLTFGRIIYNDYLYALKSVCEYKH